MLSESFYLPVLPSSPSSLRVQISCYSSIMFLFRFLHAQFNWCSSWSNLCSRESNTFHGSINRFMPLSLLGSDAPFLLFFLVFAQRNIAQCFHPGDLSASAALAYAVHVLKVEAIIVCGAFQTFLSLSLFSTVPQFETDSLLTSSCRSHWLWWCPSWYASCPRRQRKGRNFRNS